MAAYERNKQMAVKIVSLPLPKWRR